MQDLIPPAVLASFIDEAFETMAAVVIIAACWIVPVMVLAS